MRQAGRNDENTIFCFVNDPSAPISVSVFFQWQRFTDSLIRSLRRLNDAALQPACFCFTPGVFFGTHQKAALHYPNQPKPGSLCSGSVRIIVRIPFRKRKPSGFTGRESGTAVFTDQGIFTLRNIHANDLICRKAEISFSVQAAVHVIPLFLVLKPDLVAAAFFAEKTEGFAPVRMDYEMSARSFFQFLICK